MYPQQETDTANGPMDLTTGNAALSVASAIAVTRSGTEAARTKSSLHAFTPAALMAVVVPPVASYRGRWAKKGLLSVDLRT